MKRFYRRIYYPLEYRLDGTIRESTEPVAYGSWMPGIERIKTINDLAVPVVRLPDGAEEPLSDLVFKNDERKQERPRSSLEKLLDFMVARKHPAQAG